MRLIFNKPAKRWPTDDAWLESARFVTGLQPRQRTSPEESRMMLNLYNDRVPEWWPNRQESTSCGGCVKTMKDRLVAKVAALSEQKSKEEEADDKA